MSIPKWMLKSIGIAKASKKRVKENIQHEEIQAVETLRETVGVPVTV